MRPVATYTVTPLLPEALNRLPELAYNLHWTWSPETIELFRRMDSYLWEETGHNPIRMLGRIRQERLDALAVDDGFLAHLDRALSDLDDYLHVKSGRAWYPQNYGAVEQPEIAYFSFEFGLAESLPNYSGGLGMLAGDHLKAASDLNVPLVAVGLLYQQGYFRQYLNVDGWQQELYPENDFYTMPLRLMTDDNGDPILISIDLIGKEVFAQIWRVRIGRISLYLLDANLPINVGTPGEHLTDQLYGGDREMRIKQEMLLGIGGLRALYALGLEPAVIHMNEGHAAFVALERTRMVMERGDIAFSEAVAINSASTVFTTHTPVPAGNDYFKPELVEKYFKTYRAALGLSETELLALGRVNAADKNEEFCMTILALRTAAYANGVSQLHGEIARAMWEDVYPHVPRAEVPIDAITNGVHTFTWIARDMAQLYDRYLGPGWREDPTDAAIWRRAADIPDEELWRTHERLREQLVVFARQRQVAQFENRDEPPTEVRAAHEVLDPEALTIGFARRFATYKRATLLLHDRDRFANILHGSRPIQFVFAGKAHPHDTSGKEFIREIVHFARSADLRNRIVFLEDYDMVIARYLVQGVDVWLNTPRRPQEASGTSGMKAAMNGILNMSVLDGWWDEAYDPGLGWAIGRGEVYNDPEQQDEIEASAVYDLLEKNLIPSFYERAADGLPRTWISRMKAGIQAIAPVFNTARMVQDYVRDLYYPALQHEHAFRESGYERGMAFAAWIRHVSQNWDSIQIDQIRPSFNGEVLVGDTLTLEADIFLDGISPEDVAVQIYEGGLDTSGQINGGHAHDMRRIDASDRGEGWHRYRIEYQSHMTGRHGYTLRVIPHHPDLDRALRLGLITWAS